MTKIKVIEQFQKIQKNFKIHNILKKLQLHKNNFEKLRKFLKRLTVRKLIKYKSSRYQRKN